MHLRRRRRKRPVSVRRLVTTAILGVILLAGLLACGHYAARAVRLSRQRQAAMAAYAKKDYVTAERLLRELVRKDRNNASEFATLANIYREFGNTGLEAQMWQTANSLEPEDAEYREKMLTSLAKSRNYGLLHGILARKAKLDERFTYQELYLFVISSYRADYPKDGDDTYKQYADDDPEAFHKGDLGYLAEFMANYSVLSEGERDVYLELARRSGNPVVRFEAVYTSMVRMVQNSAPDDKVENLLKQLVEINGFTGTPLLVEFYYSHCRFAEAIAAADPYLEMIDDSNLYLLYVESLAFAGRLDELKDLEKKLRKKSGATPALREYCKVLIAYVENDETALVPGVRRSGKLISTPLSRFIRLRVALVQDSFNEILSVAEDIFSNPPFYDLSNQAFVLCHNYLAGQMQKTENWNDPSEMAVLAKILAGFVPEDRLLTEIILADQYKRGLTRESDLLAALKLFPDDLLLFEFAVEYLLFNSKAEQALGLIGQALENGLDDHKLDFLQMLALDQLGRYDSAAGIFRILVERSEFDLDLLAQYFDFCREHGRRVDMEAMADKLEGASDDKLKPFAGFFRAAILLLDDDEDAAPEALNLLAATPTDHPDFAFYAANMLFEAGMLDEAEAKYRAIQGTYSDPSQILVSLYEVYRKKGDADKAFETAKEAYAIEKKTSMLPAFIYAQQLAEAGKYEEAVEVLRFPRRAVDYPAEIVELWADCMRKVIEKSIQERKILQAEMHCRHLLLVIPDDEFGKKNLEKIYDLLFPKMDEPAWDGDVPAF